MTKSRRLPSKILVQQQVLGHRIDPLLSAEHVGDSHQVVIDHAREVIGGPAIAFLQDLHVDLMPVDFNRAPQQVIETTGPFPWHHQAHHVGILSRKAFLDLRLTQLQAVPVVSGLQLIGLLLCPQFSQSLLVTETVKSMALIEQPTQVLGVQVPPLALSVGAVRAAAVRTFIPIQLEPPQAVQDASFRTA